MTQLEIQGSSFKLSHNMKLPLYKPHSVSLKKMLYISLVRSQLTYCSQLWRPRFLKDIANLEQIQRRSTKYILNNYTTNYKDRLIQLNLLPLMYWYDLQDLMFLLKCLKDPDNNINIHPERLLTTN